MINIRKLETELWEAADLLRADSKVTSQEYCMPVLELIFLRYTYSRFQFVEEGIRKQQFVAFIEQVDKSKVVVQKALDEAQTLFDSLIQEYYG